MGKRNKNYDPDRYDPVAADLAKAARRAAYANGQTGHERPNAAGFHGPSKRQTRRNERHNVRAEVRAWL